MFGFAFSSSLHNRGLEDILITYTDKVMKSCLLSVCSKKNASAVSGERFYRIKFEGGKGEGERENSINKRGISMNIAGISGARCREEVICYHLLC